MRSCAGRDETELPHPGYYDELDLDVHILFDGFAVLPDPASAGAAGQWAEELTSAVLEHGASVFTLFSPEGGTPDAVSLARWAGDIVPAVRGAVSNR